MERHNPIRIALIGAGAAGSSTAVSLHRAGFPISSVSDTDTARAEKTAHACKSRTARSMEEALKEATVVIAAVPDASIPTVARTAAQTAMNLPEQIWLHLSGALPASALSPLSKQVKGIGAFHPAQAFPPGRITPIGKETLFGIDGDAPALELMNLLAQRLGSRTVIVLSQMRPLYHAACVLASNALLGVLAEATGLLSTAGADPNDAASLLVGLASGAIERASEEGLSSALTGPVQRGDAQTVSTHLEALAPHMQADRLYRETARSIIQLAQSAGRTAPEDLLLIESLLNNAGRKMP